MTDVTLYTVYDPNNGYEIARHLTAQDAMDELLTHDGYRYEIKREGDAWVLYHSDGSEASMRGARHMIRTVVFSLADEEEVAREEIARAVIAAGWPHMPECTTDEAYDRMQAEASE